MFISHINLTSSSSTAPSGQCSHNFSFLSKLCFLHNFQWTNFATASCLLLFSRCASLLYLAQFLPFHHTFYTMDFPMSCQFYSLYNLSLMLVLVQHISLLQFALWDHFAPTISKISLYLFLQAFHEQTIHTFSFCAIYFWTHFGYFSWSLLFPYDFQFWQYQLFLCLWEAFHSIHTCTN